MPRPTLRNFHIPNEMWAEIQAKAAEDQLNVSEWVRVAIRKQLDGAPERIVHHHVGYSSGPVVEMRADENRNNP